MLKVLCRYAALLTVLLVASVSEFACAADGDFAGWQHSGSMYILTTPEGANLPETAQIEGFPLLVRLNKDFFDFTQAKTNGEDLRFADSTGAKLQYQIDEWDTVKGVAAVWVKIPTIKGNARQELKLYWGKPDAQNESNGGAVFGADNGYVCVLHLSDSLKDELGVLSPQNNGTTKSQGLIGEARHMVEGKGVDCGKKITTFPFSDSPFTSECWFRAEAPGACILYWGRYATRFNGKTGDGNEVAISIGSPASLGWGSDGPGGTLGATSPRMGQWYHVAATYENGTSQIFVNGKADGKRYHKAAMSVVQDIMMCVGGIRGHYNYTGDVDEVRVSKVARSADWLKLEYENQQAAQTLVGPLVQKGSKFSVSPKSVKLAEGESAEITAQAGGAQKLYWISTKDGVESTVAVDRFSYTLAAGRVTGNTSYKLQLKAVYATETKTIDIPVEIKEAIPEPVVTLKAPSTWDGRDRIEITPVIGNLDAMKAKNAGDLTIVWSVLNGAVIKEVSNDKLLLKRSQYTGKITVKAEVDNGGAKTTATSVIDVNEPKSDPWVVRTPGKDEKPEENQFYARDDKNEGTLYYNGTVTTAADSVFLNVYADDKSYKQNTLKLGADKSYAFTVALKPGMVKYKVEFGTETGGTKAIEKTVGNLICGDAYIIQGQSNAEATGPNNSPTPDPVLPQDEWIRSFGDSHSGTVRGGWITALRTRKWGSPHYGEGQIGTWGMVLARNLVEKNKMPVCIMNGAVGGTRIDQHQRNEANHNDPKTIYGRLLTRLEAAKITHGIRGVLWHQGENNQGSASPTGDFDWKSYQQYFIDLSAAWKQDCPNIQNYYVFQIWPSGCNMGGTNAGDMLLEMQRTLPKLYSRIRIMSTMGISSKSSGRGLCHFDEEGYAQIATSIQPVIEQDFYGRDASKAMTAPNLKRAYFTNAQKNEIALEFDQPMAWKDESKTWFNLDETKAAVTTGKVDGNVVTLQLGAPSDTKTISYISGKNWDGKQDKLLHGTNGVATLAFEYVPLEK